jgi:hypothetical protein
MINPDVVEEGNRLISKYMKRSQVLEYHESWNILIPVVEKLTQDRFRSTIYFSPGSSESVIHDPLNHALEIRNYGTSDKTIRLVWKSVVEFIRMIDSGQ